ncbi:MAG TPA: hypothetical protein VGI10_24745 [Polyangiaceae bacterium]
MLATLTLASPASAEPRTHDGVYFQGTLGAGFMSTSGGGQALRGAAALESLSVGGTPFPGLALGASSLGAIGISPSGKLAAGTASDPSALHDPSLSIVLLGPFADYYFDPHAGFHMQAMAGYALVSARQSSNPSASDPQGLGFSLGLGQEVWVGDDWSVGVLGRFTLALPRYHDVSYPTFAPGIVASFTCH